MDDERLIVEVEKHAIIYDSTDPFYKDNGRKEKAWHLIAEVLGVDADTCKGRWKALRDAFVKNRKKGSTFGTQKEWKYADIMFFLLPHIQPRGSSSSHSQNGEEKSGTQSVSTQSSSSSEDWPSSRGISLKQPSTPPPPSTSAPYASRSRSPRDRPSVETSRPAVAAQAPRETRRGQRPDADIAERLMSLLEQPVPKPHMPDGELDEAYHFALSIVPMLHRLSKDRRQQAKIEILALLHNLERAQAEEATVQQQQPQQQYQIMIKSENGDQMMIKSEDDDQI